MLGLVLLFLNIGTPELILIMFVALLLFGGDKLPGLARGLGKGIRDFKDASEGVKREINNQINSYEDKKPSSGINLHKEDEPVDTHDYAYHNPEPETTTETGTEPEQHKPLIDTSPVAGTTPLGGSPVSSATADEHHTTDEHAHTPAEPVKHTHE